MRHALSVVFQQAKSCVSQCHTKAFHGVQSHLVAGKLLSGIISQQKLVSI